MRLPLMRVALLLQLVAVAASAAGAADPSVAAPPLIPPAAADKSVEVRMGEVEIKGEIERPAVFYIIPRREMELDLGHQTRDYTPELSRPLDAAAFKRWVHLQRAPP